MTGSRILRIHGRRRWIAVALASIVLNGACAAWFLAASPWKREQYLARVASQVHAVRPVVLIGDSILAALEPPEGVLNLAVSGATVPFTVAEVLPAAIGLEPRRVVIGLGINDLRSGTSPERVAEGLSDLVRQLAADDPGREIVVLAILPLARGTAFGGTTDNTEIARANTALLEAALTSDYGFIDHRAMFSVVGALDDRLTHDGLHLNAAGQAILFRLLFGGLATGTL